MRTVYLDLGMGAAGDMLSAALLELLPDTEAFVNRLNALGLPDIEFVPEKTFQCGIQGTHMHVRVKGEEESELLKHEQLHHHHCHDHHHEHSHEPHHEHSHEHGHSHTGLARIEHIVNDHLDLPEAVKKDILAVYQLLAEAESHAHGVPVSDIHFHEVGTMDALADITAVCLLLHELNPDQVLATPVCTGSGTVRCAHGILPVPAPATAYLLRGIPAFAGKIETELCTPTGAALLKHFVDRFEPMPVLETEAIGYGMGTKQFEQANCVRALLGNSPEEQAESQDRVIQLACNLDDMSAEDIGFAMDVLLEAGALDVWTVSIGMKKNRPGTMLNVLAREADADALVKLLFLHTTTLGIRRLPLERYTLERKTREMDTPWGTVRVKEAEGYGVKREKYEFDDLARSARKSGKSLAILRDELDSRNR